MDHGRGWPRPDVSASQRYPVALQRARPALQKKKLSRFFFQTNRLRPPPPQTNIVRLKKNVDNWRRPPSFGDVASGASHDIGARNPIEIFRSRPSFGDVASAASHDIGARNVIEIV